MRQFTFDLYSNGGRMYLTCIRREREGRAMKYMGDYYRTRTTFDLNVLRSKKYLRLTKLRNEPATYTNMRERKNLQEQMNWIDAELRCRAEQQQLL